jgi:hypothetical protein
LSQNVPSPVEKSQLLNAQAGFFVT